MEKHGLRNSFINKFTFIYSSIDKIYIFSSIYLSRNTDYYRNTIKWIRTIVENNCIEQPFNCLDYIKSYQYRELVSIWRNTTLDPETLVNEFNLLMSLKGFGLKSINAYMLHVYGCTEYAPIDRHYVSLLDRVGLKGKIPSKNYCLKNKLNCRKCKLSGKCLYSIVYNRFGVFNGIIQSINYVYSRLKRIIDNRSRISHLEEKLLSSNLDKYLSFIDEYEKFIDLLTSIDKFIIDN